MGKEKGVENHVTLFTNKMAAADQTAATVTGSTEHLYKVLVIGEFGVGRWLYSTFYTIYFTFGPTEIIVLKWCFSDSFRCARSSIWRRLIFFEVLAMPK